MPSIPYLVAGAQTSDISVQKMIVTPTIASIWMQNNTRNRPLRNMHVEKLKGALLRDEWQFNGETIKFAKTNELLDGQHRLKAVMESGKSVEMLVAWNLDPAVIETIDVGAMRSFSDWLKYDGRIDRQYHQNAAAITLLCHILGLGDHTVQPTMVQKATVLSEHLGIKDASGPGYECHRTTGLNRSSSACGWYRISEVASHEQVDKFWEGLCSGEGLSHGDPRLAVRRYVISTGTESVNIKKYLHYGALIKAWNAWGARAEMKLIRLSMKDKPLAIVPLRPTRR